MNNIQTLENTNAEVTEDNISAPPSTTVDGVECEENSNAYIIKNIIVWGITIYVAFILSTHASIIYRDSTFP